MRTRLTALATGFVVAAALLSTAAPSNAIVGASEPDTQHLNVGVLLPSPNMPVPRWCGGTLIAPRVFLVAGHCVALRAQMLGETDGVVTFDRDIRDGVQSATYHGEMLLHPSYGSPGSLSHDVGLVVLDSAVTGVPVQPLPAAGLLDDLQRAGTLRDEPLTLVGYGTTQRLPGNVFVAGGERRAADQRVQSLTGLWLRHQGVTDGGTACIYDSGSPLFRGGTLVGVLSQGDGACSTLSVSARVDIPAIRSWLTEQIAAAAAAG